MASVKITYFDRAGVLAALGRYVAALVADHPEVRRIVLFGSLARGDAVPGSDVDLLIVVAHSSLPFRERIPQYLPDGFPVGMDVFPYTEEEIEAMQAEGNSFIRRALSEGIVLYPEGEA